MQIREKEAVKLLPPQDFIINNLSKKQMIELAGKMGCNLRSSATKAYCADQLAKLYLYFPNLVKLVMDDQALDCLKTLVQQDCQGDTDLPGLDTLCELGMVQLLGSTDRQLAVVPRAYAQCALVL